jgi:hypothetical protein
MVGFAYMRVMSVYVVLPLHPKLYVVLTFLDVYYTLVT